MIAEPLPRSLEPLKDESLLGYLLRLSHRLDLPPARLAERTGLVSGPQGWTASSLVLDLPQTPRPASHTPPACPRARSPN